MLRSKLNLSGCSPAALIHQLNLRPYNNRVMIAFSCHHCGAQLQVDDSRAGISGPCPACSRVVHAPSAARQTGGGRASSQRTLAPSAGVEDTSPALPELAPPPEYPFLAPPQRPDELGRLGPYRILKVLGTGAMGVVFQAEDLHLKRQVALKVMLPSLAASGEYHRRFLREAELAAALDHEHIVAVYQVGEDRGVPYLAMKLLRGETLEDRLRRTGGRLPLAELLRIGREIAEGLTAAHARGLIHRDIKPANIWLETDGDRVKIVDFGLARGTGSDAQLTQAGSVIGTPAYMAPEQANAAEVDHRSDLFSLGAVLYRAGTGELPFGGRDTLSVLNALATRTPPLPHQIVPSLPRGFSRLVMHLLAKDAAQRPQSAREVAEIIEALERGEEPEAAAALPPEAIPAPRGRKRPEAAAPPESVGKEDRERPEVKRQDSKKVRSGVSRRKKRPAAEWDWGRLVLVASLVFLGFAVLLLLFVALRQVSKARAAADFPSSGIQLASARERHKVCNLTGQVANLSYTHRRCEKSAYRSTKGRAPSTSTFKEPGHSFLRPRRQAFN
jgi:serine/threonine protein kinase